MTTLRVLEWVLMTLLFAALVCSAVAMRYYSHAGFISSMPVDSGERVAARRTRGCGGRGAAGFEPIHDGVSL